MWFYLVDVDDDEGIGVVGVMDVGVGVFCGIGMVGGVGMGGVGFEGLLVDM